MEGTRFCTKFSYLSVTSKSILAVHRSGPVSTMRDQPPFVNNSARCRPNEHVAGTSRLNISGMRWRFRFTLLGGGGRVEGRRGPPGVGF